uniref:Uncharacterized protein LOC105036677 n=1 Tax=Elaeis guineensis var. tenera TaxID=51953 RepID=A0A6I9QMM8_ELAGV
GTLEVRSKGLVRSKALLARRPVEYHEGFFFTHRQRSFFSPNRSWDAHLIPALLAATARRSPPSRSSSSSPASAFPLHLPALLTATGVGLPLRSPSGVLFPPKLTESPSSMGASSTQVNKAHKSRFASKASRQVHKTSRTDKKRIAKPDHHRNAVKGTRAARIQRSKM